MDDNKRRVTVLCGVQSGLLLRTYTTRDVEGERHAVPDGGEIHLKPGSNPDIDAEQMEKWLEDHKDSDLVLRGIVSIQPDVPEEAYAPLEDKGSQEATGDGAEAARAARATDQDSARQNALGGEGVQGHFTDEQEFKNANSPDSAQNQGDQGQDQEGSAGQNAG